jgi:hypothetical protein
MDSGIFGLLIRWAEAPRESKRRIRLNMNKFFMALLYRTLLFNLSDRKRLLRFKTPGSFHRIFMPVNPGWDGIRANA